MFETTITKSFGSFSIPSDWNEKIINSKYGKHFYSHKSEPVSSTMTNISIELGKNSYDLEQHETFRQAILNQLIMQNQREDVYVFGSGTFTEHDYMLYIFTIEEKEPHVTTIQMYIIGNKKHILNSCNRFS